MNKPAWSGPVRDFTVAIDFDGTLITDAWPQCGVDMPGGAEVIAWLLSQGARIIIWTCRTEKQCPPGAPWSDIQYVHDWLKDHGFRWDLGIRILVNDNFSDIREKFNHSESRKVFAHVYVDDKNLGGFPGWRAAHATLQEALEKFLQRRALRDRGIMVSDTGDIHGPQDPAVSPVRDRDPVNV